MISEDKVIKIFMLIYDLLKLNNHRKVSKQIYDSEIITTSLVSTLHFKGHLENAMGYMKSSKLIPNMLRKSRFNRQLHSISVLIQQLFFNLGLKK